MRTKLSRLIAITALAFWLAPCSALAATSWTDWTGATAGAPGSASGVVAGVGVTYSGELDAFVVNGTSPIWLPNSSFIGGTSTASPSIVGDDLRLNGSFTGTNTITFASLVENPVFAIWSLGSPSIPATFTFNVTPTFEAGGRTRSSAAER